MCFEGPDNLESLRENANLPIIAAHEYIVRTRTNAAQFIALATSAWMQTVHAGGWTDIENRGALSVVWWFDFGDVEEIKDFPLCKLCQSSIF